MTDDEIINKFRKVLRDYIAGDLTPEEIEEIIDKAFSELDITNEHIIEQFQKDVDERWEYLLRREEAGV